MSAANNPALNRMYTRNNIEMKSESAASHLYRMAKVQDFSEMFLRSLNLYAIQKDCFAQNKHMAAMKYISHTGEIVKAS